MQWYLSERLKDLDFPDDVCLQSHNRTDKQGKIRLLEQYFQKTYTKNLFNHLLSCAAIRV